MEETVTATGTLRPSSTAILVAETPGRLQVAHDVHNRRLAEGSVVQKGQVVVKLLGDETRLHAGLESREKSLRVAQEEVKRQHELHSRELASQRRVDEAERVLANALHAYEVSALSVAKTNLVAPISGTIMYLARSRLGTPLAQGQLVRPGQTLAEIASTALLVADIELMGQELSRLRMGMGVRLRYLGDTEPTASGELMRILPDMDPHRGTFRAEVEVENGANVLRPGMFVEATLVVGIQADAVVVSNSAVVRRDGADVAFVLDAHRASRRHVRLGLRDDEKVQVLAGLEIGERVIEGGLETLTDGARVRVLGP